MLNNLGDGNCFSGPLDRIHVQEAQQTEGTVNLGQSPQERKEEEMKKMKEYKEDLLEIHPIFQMLEDDRVERRQEKPFLELFKEFYKEERGIQPSKEMIEMLEEIIGRENRDETSSIDNTRIE